MPNNFNHQVEQLRHQFLAGLPQRAHQIEDLWNRLRYMNWSQQGIKTLHNMAHKLSGSGSSFGLPEVSNCAQILDNYLQEHEDLGQPFGGIEREIIDQMVANLVRVLNHGECEDNSQNTVTPNNNIGEGKHIFVVDDDHALSSLIAAYLETCNFRVQLFNNPAECIQQLHQQTPDAIIMDIGFHGENLQGLDALEFIKVHFGTLVPIILLSARCDMHARLRALRAGCTHYLSKPVDFFLLTNTLSTAINNRTTTHKVMIVDDESLVAQYHAEILRNAGMDVIYITNPLQSLQRAIEFKPDLIMLDMHMPDVNGMELATLLREENEFLALPIIFVTADTSDALRHSLESLGVNGVLTKPVDIKQLVESCKRAIDDTVALKNRIARVTQRAHHHQQITRSYFFSAIENARQQYDKNSAAVYYIGLDSIDRIYELYGQTGVAALHEQLCQLMSQVIGTDEQWTDISNLIVCVLASRTSQHHLQRAAQIIARLNTFAFTVNGEQLLFDVSLGIEHLNVPSTSVNDILRHAEKAYEKARMEGGNCAIEYDATAEIQKKIPEPNVDFSEGLPTENLCIAYQPMISFEEQNIEHYEALIRWKTGAEKPIPAAKFLHHIEQQSLQTELDRWVLQHAIAAISGDSSTRENTNLFIHLSEETLTLRSFFTFAANVLRNSRLRGDKRLVFMLEESWIATHHEQTTVIIEIINQSRCGICLAHAGTTNNTEKIIQEFPFDYIKLTPELTATIDPDFDKNTRLKAITTAAKLKNAQVIATQVEDAKNLSTLWLSGIRLFQGFFIQSPEQHFQKRADVDFVKQFLSVTE